MSYFLAIDQGTHASRACLLDQQGKILLSHSHDISLSHIDQHHIEQDPEEIIDSVNLVVNAVLSEINDKNLIKACAIATQRSSVLAWQPDGTPLSAVISWQDTRSVQRIKQLKQHEVEIKQLSGLPLSAHYGGSKMAGLASISSAEKNAVLRLSPLASYLAYHLLDNKPYIIDHSNAQRTQLFDIHKENWSDRLLTLFDVSLKNLPQCVPVVNRRINGHGTLVNTTVPVRVLCGDQNAAFHSDGQPEADTAYINIGSGAFILCLQNGSLHDERLLTGIASSTSDSVLYMHEATINGAGNALGWLVARHTEENIYDQLPQWLAEIKKPPVFINTVGGLGSPWWKSGCEPVFLSEDNTTGHIAEQAVAVLESILFMIQANLEIMRNKQTINKIRLSGGLSSLDGLCQRLANLALLPVERTREKEATARGAVWLSLKKKDNWIPGSSDNFTPQQDTELVERYRKFIHHIEGNCL